MTRVNTAVAAPIRTAGQLTAGATLVEFYAAFWATDWTNRQYMAAVGAATLIVVALQHLIENRCGKAVLRDVPPTTAPVVDEAGYSLVEVMVAAFFAVLIVVVLLRIL